MAEVSGWSVKQLKEFLRERGADSTGLTEKSEYVAEVERLKAIEGAGGAVSSTDAPPSEAAPWESMSVKELKAALEGCGVARREIDGCLDKADLRALAHRHADRLGAAEPAGVPSATAASAAAAAAAGAAERGAVDRGTGAAVRDPSEGGGDDGDDEWSGMSAKQLKELLMSRHISIKGCYDKADLLAACRENRSKLLAAVPAPPTAARRVDAAQQKTDRRKAELLERLGGVVHGGYQVDLFGTKRGRCGPNPKCFRYAPGNAKLNGCAMKGTGAVTCQRCGYQNLEHEDLGRWDESEPHMIDEHGDGWRFENAVDGVRRVLVPRAKPL